MPFMPFDSPQHRFRERLLVATAAAVLSAEADDQNLKRPWDPRPLARELESLGQAEVTSSYEFALGSTTDLSHARAVAFAIETLDELWPGASADILGGFA